MNDKISNWRTKIFLWVGLPVIALIGLGMAGPDIAPAWQAKSGGGTPGTFTAVREDCGRRTCNLHGDFVAANGATRRPDVLIYGAPDGLTTDGTMPARDTGARKGVFAEGMGWSHLLIITGFALVGVLAAVAWVVLVVRTIRRRRRADTGPF